MLKSLDLALITFPELIETVKKYAQHDTPVLIRGESGTGKELVAQIIHEFSRVKKGPFVPVNCSSVPQDLLESKFFGHYKGAFTGAETNKKGLFQVADGGTLFLDEIADMCLSLQPKLLRAVQFQSFYPVGSEKEVQVKTRIIAATNGSLENLVKNNKFRSDLFYRLNVLSIHIKPLREKTQDIPRLLAFFFKKYEKNYNMPSIQITDKVYEKLLNYKWPGNIRELENIVHRISVFCTDNKKSVFDISALDLVVPELIRAPSSELYLEKNLLNCNDLNKTLNDLEKKLIIQALLKHNWNKSRASKSLKIKRTTLIQKVKKFNLHPDNFSQKDLFEFFSQDTKSTDTTTDPSPLTPSIDTH